MSDYPEMPRRIQVLEAVAPGYRAGCVASAGGGFVWSRQTEAAHKRHLEAIAQKDREEHWKLSERDAEIAKLEARRDRLEIAAAVFDAAVQAGVRGDLVDAVGALLRDQFVVVEDQAGNLRVVTSDTGADAGFVLEAFLESDRGKPYRPKGKASPPGPLARQMREMLLH